MQSSLDTASLAAAWFCPPIFSAGHGKPPCVHPGFHIHFTPTSSWLNMVELWSNIGFATLIDKRIRRGSFASVSDLMAITYDYLDDY